MPLPIPFDKDRPDWNLNGEKYPQVFVVDACWTNNSDALYRVDPGSLVLGNLVGCTPLINDNGELLNKNGVYIHGEKTLHVLKTIAQNLPNDRITLVSARRNMDEEFDGVLPPFNLPEALLSVQMQLKAGDFVVINLQDEDANSFADDELIALYLKQLTDAPKQGGFGGIVVISAGNGNVNAPLPASAASGVIVVGAVSADGKPASRFGPGVCCYEVVPYTLAVPPSPPTCPLGYGINFGGSSAATAYVAGLVLVMLNQANANGQLLTGKQLVDLLKNTSLQSNGGQPVLGELGSLPDWNIILS